MKPKLDIMVFRRSPKTRLGPGTSPQPATTDNIHLIRGGGKRTKEAARRAFRPGDLPPLTPPIWLVWKRTP